MKFACLDVQEGKKLREIEYERRLDFNARLRAQYQVSRGRVVQFTVQLEVLRESQCLSVIRYDTAHHFAHRDAYEPNGRRIKIDLNMTFEEALSFAVQDLRDRWESYRDEFLQR